MLWTANDQGRETRTGLFMFFFKPRVSVREAEMVFKTKVHRKQGVATGVKSRLKIKKILTELSDVKSGSDDII